MSQSAENKISICVTIPPHLVRALDRIAENEERSRSWMLSRAIESFIAPPAGECESGAAVGAQDVAGLVAPRNAAPGPSFSGAAPLSESVDTQMAGYSSTPEAAPAVRATPGLHTDTLQRAAEQSRRVAADKQRAREDTDRRNAEYLTGKTAA